MSRDSRSCPEALQRFRTLAAALAQATQSELECSGSISLLLDDAGAVRMALEFSAAEQCAYAVRPFMPIPADERAAAKAAARLLGLSAVRAAVAGAVFGSDTRLRQFCLVLPIDLEIDTAALMRSIDTVVSLGERVRAAVGGEVLGAREWQLLPTPVAIEGLDTGPVAHPRP